VGNKFKVGDLVQPNQSENYVYTKSPHMIEGIVTKVHGDTDIRVKVTKGDGTDYDRTGYAYPVSSKYFDLVKPMDAERGFEALIAGTITDKQYEEIVRRERG
jgi:hypothetical protein